MQISTENKGPALLIRLCGRLDAATSPEFEKRALEAVSLGSIRIIIDLAGLEYVSSAGLRCFLILAKKVRASGGALAVCGLAGMVSEVFQISGFQNLFPAGATVDDALRLLGTGEAQRDPGKERQ